MIINATFTQSLIHQKNNISYKNISSTICTVNASIKLKPINYVYFDLIELHLLFINLGIPGLSPVSCTAAYKPYGWKKNHKKVI